MRDEEIKSRAINAQPWEPMPSMVKRQCLQCRYFFATPEATAAGLCPDRTALGTRNGTAAAD
jgi:hypothetical protein